LILKLKHPNMSVQLTARASRFSALSISYVSVASAEGCFALAATDFCVGCDEER